MKGRLLLAIKIGNTNIGFGIFSGDQIRSSWRIETRPEQTTDEYASEITDLLDMANGREMKIEDVAICSVVPALTSTLGDYVRRYLHCDPFVVIPNVRSGINIKYDDPRSLGGDRLVAMVAAKARYSVPTLVIDIGTATTFNLLDADGDFVGGAIAPGPNIQSEALHLFTAKLPRVEIAEPDKALATNTRDALKAGLFFGQVGLIEGIASELLREMGEPGTRVVATGGLAPLLAPHCPSIQIVDTGLALEGLRILYQMNTGRFLQN